MSRFARLALLLAAAALLTAVAPASASAASDDPTATASRTCSVGDYRSYGTTYVHNPIRTRNVRCRRARRLIRAFHACRPGRRGRCRRVDGFRCRENREYARDEYFSRVRCVRGSKVVRHTYSQHL